MYKYNFPNNSQTNNMKEGDIMKSENKKIYSEENFLANGTKVQNQKVAKNSFNTSIEEPALNESGIEAKKKGF